MAALDIVIVDFKAGELLRNCLRSLVEHPPRHAHLDSVVIVDNAPGAQSIRTDEANVLPIRIISNEVNRGFGAGCNQGAREGTAAYILFLNPDTRVTEGALDCALAYLEDRANEKTGIVSVQLLDERGCVTRSCRRFPRPSHYLNRALGLDRISPSRFPNGYMTDWDHRETRVVDQVMGAFFLVRRSVFEALEGFDERFFVYFEEVDLSLRVALAGFHSVHLADAQVYHSGHGTTQRLSAMRLFYSLRSRTQYGRKHFGVAGAVGVVVVSALIEPLARVFTALAGGSVRLASDTWAAYRMYWRWLVSSRTPNVRARGA
jgi:GT2 family glycosyltransferase